MSWSDLESDSAEAVLLEFGEDVVYTPYGGAARTILAIVDRNPPAPVGGDSGRVHQPRLQISVANRATAKSTDNVGGIAWATLNGSGADTVTVTYQTGTAQTFRVFRPAPGDGRRPDSGMIHLDLM